MAIQKFLGHTSIQMTMRYAHLTPDHLRHTIGKLAYGHSMDTGHLMKTGNS